MSSDGDTNDSVNDPFLFLSSELFVRFFLPTVIAEETESSVDDDVTNASLARRK